VDRHRPLVMREKGLVPKESAIPEKLGPDKNGDPDIEV